MAQPPPPVYINIKQPEPFCFVPTQWPAYKTLLARYSKYSTMATLSLKAQKEVILMIMGPEADEAFIQFKDKINEDTGTVDDLLSQFDLYFKPQVNTVFERGKFFDMKQPPSQTNAFFIKEVYKQAEKCQFPADSKEDMIRDKLCHGIIDRSLAAKLREDNELTLGKVLTKLKSLDNMKEELSGERQGLELDGKHRQEEFSPSIDVVRRPEENSNSLRGKSQHYNYQKNRKFDGCQNCGYFRRHDLKFCKAREVKCYNCSEIGHFQRYCKKSRSQTVAVIQSSTSILDDDSDFEIARIQEMCPSKSEQWMVHVNTNGTVVPYKVDSGADVTVVTGSTASLLTSSLESADKIKLKGPDGKYLSVVGCFQVRLGYKDKYSTETIYVINNLKENLLSRNAAVSLDILEFKPAVINRVNCTTGFDPVTEFPKVFTGLGRMKKKYKITLKEGAQPYSVTSPRNLARPLREPVQARLDEMEKAGVISKTDEPGEWCFPLVVVPKPNKKVRICVDYQKLNENVIRDRVILPTIQESLSDMAGGKFFSKLDMVDSFWQVELEEESKKFTVFITPFGRFQFNRLPMGLTSSPEYFHGSMTEMLKPVVKKKIHIDDVVVWGDTIEEHDENLRLTLSIYAANNVTLNMKKCTFRVPEVPWIGSIVGRGGIRIDPERVRAILDMEPPKNKAEVRSFIAKTSFVRDSVHHFADIMRPISDLGKEDSEFVWGLAQKQAFDEFRKIITGAPIRESYDVNADHRLISDASYYGVGCVLQQKSADGQWKIVAYGSRKLNSTEQLYSVIEKEALAIVWSCYKFQDSLLGKSFQVLTDHNPLVSIFNNKDINSLSPRLQRFKIKALKFDFSVAYIPGKEMYMPDLLSRKPVDAHPEDFQVHSLLAVEKEFLKNMPIADAKLIQLRHCQHEDPLCIQLAKYVRMGFPNQKNDLPMELKPYFDIRNGLSILQGILFYHNRVFIPEIHAEKTALIKNLHLGHVSLTKMRERAKGTVFWLGINRDMRNHCDNCIPCLQRSTKRSDPLLPSPPTYFPWQQVGTDVATHDGKHYIVFNDFYSKFIFAIELRDLSSFLTIKVCTRLFEMFGNPMILRSDNATNYSSWEFTQFLNSRKIQHETSSPHFSQSNGAAEAAVKIVKRILQTGTDLSAGLLYHNNTNIQGRSYSPAQLFFGRQLRTTLPASHIAYLPNIIPLEEVRRDQELANEKMKLYFDQRNRSTEHGDFIPGDHVWVPDLRDRGVVIEKSRYPRAYIVKVRGKTYRRNVSFLRNFCASPAARAEQKPVEIDIPENNTQVKETPTDIPTPIIESTHQQPIVQQSARSPEKRSRYGRIIKPNINSDFKYYPP